MSKPSPTSNVKPHRLPVPTLFVGPPSRNASQLSVSRPATDAKPSRDPLNRQKSALSRAHNVETNGNAPGAKYGDRVPTIKKPSEKDTDAKWREMQSTLNEVELTAQSSTHVFGQSHAAALDELRMAQIELARAWGRGTQDQAAAGAGQDAAEANIAPRFQGADEIAMDRVKQAKAGRKRGDTETSVSTALSDESARSADSARSGASQLEDETAQDIRLASERRATNEAYFKKVDEGVKDVVAKLGKVAEAMKAVESESRSLWSGSERGSTEEENPNKQIAAVVSGR